MAPPKSAASRSQPADSHDESDSPATPDPNRELMQQLAEQLATANARIAALEAERQQQPAAQDHQPKDPKLPPPSEFSGKISEFRNFMAQCTLTFTMCPNTYNTDERKVLFVVSLLRGSALSWAREIAENENHLLRNDYTAFKTAMSNVYLDQNYKELCQTKLDSLQQTRSAASYAVEFATLAAALTLNDEAKCLNFYRGLGQDVKDGMAIIGRASTYDALVKQAISIDQRSHQRRLESKSESNNQNKSRFSGNTRNTNNSSKFNSAPPNSASPNPGAKRFESKPREPLSDEEKARRKRLNLCIYCSDPKHSVADCPHIAAKDAKVNTVSLPPPRYPQPSENSQPQAPTRTEA